MWSITPFQIVFFLPNVCGSDLLDFVFALGIEINKYDFDVVVHDRSLPLPR